MRQRRAKGLVGFSTGTFDAGKEEMMRREAFHARAFVDDSQTPESGPSSFRGSRYLSEPFPCPVDVAVLRHVVRFARADGPHRAWICTATVSGWQMELLLRFAERMARVALEKRDVRLVQAGLVALAIVGQRATLRAIWRVMGLLHASAEELTPDPARVFRKVSFMASSSGIDQLLDSYVNRDSDGRVI
jgi:hypothetical protein